MGRMYVRRPHFEALMTTCLLEKDDWDVRISSMKSCSIAFAICVAQHPVFQAVFFEPYSILHPSATDNDHANTLPHSRLTHNLF